MTCISGKASGFAGFERSKSLTIRTTVEKGIPISINNCLRERTVDLREDGKGWIELLVRAGNVHGPQVRNGLSLITHFKIQ